MKFIKTGITRSDAKRKVSVMIDDRDYAYLSQFNWTAHSSGIVTTRGINGKHQQIHRVIMKPSENQEVDHIDGNRLNNRRSNLRLCNSSENKCNRGPRKDNKSGYKGVSWHKQNQKWTVRLKTPYGKYLSLGCYSDIKEAALAYNNAAKKYHGKFAFLNQL